MISTVKNFLRKEVTKNEIISFILNQEEHRWIKENNYVNAHFLDFLERLPRKVLQNVFIEKMTLFVRSSGRFSCAVTSFQQNIIIIFPEVYNLMTKPYDAWAKAVLAHEVGHIHLNHSEKTEAPRENQVDADTFACECGYLEEIESFLHEQPESIEKRVRLSFITNYYFTNVDPSDH